MLISTQTASNDSSTPMSRHGSQLSTVLKASYLSPSGVVDIQHVITTPASHAFDTEAKTQYLGELRASSRKLQDEINKFLTNKMEEDRTAQDQARSGGTSLQKTQDELEEENYGEEVAEEDT